MNSYYFFTYMILSDIFNNSIYSVVVSEESFASWNAYNGQVLKVCIVYVNLTAIIMSFFWPLFICFEREWTTIKKITLVIFKKEKNINSL